MNQKVQTLFNEDEHCVLFFTDLVAGEAIPSNQMVIIDHGEAALFDPGGELTFTPLSIELAKHLNVKSDLKYVFASHQDPDIITSLPRWLIHSECKIVTSRLWARFLPHLVSDFVTGKMNKTLMDRMVEVPDEGGKIRLGKSAIIAVPAHFLHSVGNFHFYDPVSKVLFSGDVGAAMTPGEDNQPVQDMDDHIPLMEGFHKRYMACNKACRIWVDQVRALDIEMMVPQHGKAFIGKDKVAAFLSWFEQLECGVDLM